MLFIATEIPTDHPTKLDVPPAQRDSEAWHGKISSQEFYSDGAQPFGFAVFKIFLFCSINPVLNLVLL